MAALIWVFEAAMHLMRRIFFFLFVLSGFLVPATSATAQGSLQTIRLSLLPFSESLGAVIADKEGFFKEAGIQVDIKMFDSGALALPVLQSGRIDIAFSNTIATLQIIERGLDLVILGPGAAARNEPPDTTAAIMVRKGSLKSLKDLEGKRVAVNVINSATWLFAVAALEKDGVDWTKVRFVELPNPQQNAALLNGQVDAVTQPEPFRTVLMETGQAEIAEWPEVKTAPGGDITQYIALSSWVAKNRDTAISFARAVARGATFANSNDAATRDINQQFTHLNPAYKDKVQLPYFGSKVNVAGMQDIMTLMIKYKLLKGPIDISQRILQIP
jgi:NitT/TauT family transport system substrate-binding protein